MQRVLETRIIGTLDPAAPTLVFLHEGLGSVSAWRDFPEQVCNACGLAGFFYSRHGYGQSPRFDGPLDPNFMHDAAEYELSGLIKKHNIRHPILFGHSDGASIALIYAARFADQPIAPLAVVAMAPHIFVEPISIKAIRLLHDGFKPNDGFRARLANHHLDADRTFRTWTQAWLNPAFENWDIRGDIAAIRCPVLAIQGHQDQYGTMRQLDELAQIVPQAELVKLPDCGHSPHRDQTEEVINAVQLFLGHIMTDAAPTRT